MIHNLYINDSCAQMLYRMVLWNFLERKSRKDMDWWFSWSVYIILQQFFAKRSLINVYDIGWSSFASLLA